MELGERFWRDVDRSGGPDACWPWRGWRIRGYGGLSWGGRSRRATHLALELSGRPVPAGAVVRHSCDNPPCCNPRHLTAGTQAENIRDAQVRGRLGGAKLTPGDVREIRGWLAVGGWRQLDIASAYGVSESIVSAIRLGRIWRFV